MPGPGPRPLFLDGPHGRLFAVYYEPIERRDPTSPAVLYLPPFAEEMNRARRMAAVQARALARAGVGVLVLDPFGTGDSAGDFADARWAIWLDDAAFGLAWLHAQGHGGLALLGLRLGACLALEAAARAPRALERIVLWSPVVRGDLLLNQFLRIRAMAGLDLKRDAGAEGTKALGARLRGGATLEIAGYALHPELAAALERLRLSELAGACRAPIVWFELAGEAGAALPPASAAALEALGQAGIAVRAATVPGEPFWSIEETVLAPELVARTTALWAP